MWNVSNWDELCFVLLPLVFPTSWSRWLKMNQHICNIARTLICDNISWQQNWQRMYIYMIFLFYFSFIPSELPWQTMEKNVNLIIGGKSSYKRKIHDAFRWDIVMCQSHVWPPPTSQSYFFQLKNQPNACKRALCWPHQLFGIQLGGFGMIPGFSIPASWLSARPTD